MALTKVSTDGVKDDAITSGKIPANQIEASELADNAVDTNAIADQAVALSKLPHGDGSSDGKFLRANNGADPTFETVTGTTINNNANNRIITGSSTANTLEGEANLTYDGGGITLTGTNPYIDIVDSNNDSDFTLKNDNGTFEIEDKTNSSTARLAIDSSGRLLVGKNATKASDGENTAKAQIESTGNCMLDIAANGTTSSSYAGLNLIRSDGSSVNDHTAVDSGDRIGRINFIGADGSDRFNSCASIRAFAAADFSANNCPAHLTFLTNGGSAAPSERMRITKDGFIGIGTDSPDKTVHIMGPDGAVSGASSGNSDTALVIENSGTNGAIIEMISDNNGAARIVMTDSDASNQGMIVYTHSNNTLALTANGGNPQLELRSDSKAFFNVVNSFMAIDKNNTGTIIDFIKSGNSVGSVGIGSSDTSFNTSSDYRLKENITSLTGAITRMKQLLPKRFNFISDEDNTLRDGFLAHEVSSIVPEAITGTKDQVATSDDVAEGKASSVGNPIYQSIDHSKLVPLLVACCQELITKVEALEAA